MLKILKNCYAWFQILYENFGFLFLGPIRTKSKKQLSEVFLDIISEKLPTAHVQFEVHTIY